MNYDVGDTKNVFDNNGLDILPTQGLHRNYINALRLCIAECQKKKQT